jgi:hypothetical protein
MDILFFLILGHLAGDYALQTDYMAANKRISVKVLSLHVLVYALTLWAFFFFYSLLYQPGLYLHSCTLIFLALLYLQHWAQDFLKSRYQNGSKQMYYLDQVIHLAVLYLYRIFIYH